MIVLFCYDMDFFMDTEGNSISPTICKEIRGGTRPGNYAVSTIGKMSVALN